MSLDRLTTEARNPASANLDELTAVEIARLMNSEDRRAVESVGLVAEAVARAIEVIAERLARGGRLIYAGAGTSGRLGVLDATECPPTFNTPPEMVIGLIAGGPPALTRAVEGAEDSPETGANDLRGVRLTADDVFVGIATSGRTPYVLGAADYARQVGAKVIGLACNEGSELESRVDIMLCPIVGPEVLSGSTRLKAGTATKLILNTLTTGAMVRMGKTLGNLMVDLRATNIKLKARTNRIVRTVCGVDESAAARLLDQAGGELKTALVMHSTGASADESRKMLDTVDGRVRDALAAAGRQMPSASDAQLVLGLDGGGTHTVAILADGERTLGRGVAGPSNLQAVGVPRALAALDSAIDRAFADADRPRVTVGAICLGLAGADRPQEKALIREWVSRHRVAEWCDVTNDGALLIGAGTPDLWGVAVVAGTGSIAVARSPDGRIARSGGWGFLLGDEGSGYALAMDGLRAAAKASDGRAGSTLLVERLLQAMDLKVPSEFIPAVYRGGWDRAALASLAPVVIDAAIEQDATAAHIVRDNAQSLAHTVIAAAKSLGLRLDRLPLAMSGGALLCSDHYAGELISALLERGTSPDPVTPVDDPAVGAVRIARTRTPLTV
ncbi:MAG: N-acetylmuramic acid 6-phosphate etherase [Gemmataceae bacterium]|nr:N-acetylmuramic acid 6-phosphate etherase [Gemmataceae bacterium]